MLHKSQLQLKIMGSRGVKTQQQARTSERGAWTFRVVSIGAFLGYVTKTVAVNMAQTHCIQLGLHARNSLLAHWRGEGEGVGGLNTIKIENAICF